MEATPPAAPLDRRTAVALGVLVAVCRALQWRSFPLYDDAFITLRYAENFAAGSGLVYNPGAAWEPVLGTTTPLYALALGLLGALGLPLESSALAFNALCDGVTGACVALALASRPLAAFASVLVFCALPHVARISAGGMEPPLFVALAASASLAASRARLATAGWLSALACTTRPEGVLLVAALAVTSVRSWRDARRMFAPVLIVGVASASILTAIYGSPIAQSVRAKAGRHGLGIDLARAASTLQQAFAPTRLLVALSWLTLWGIMRSALRAPGLRAFAVFAVAVPAAYIVSGAKTWGWYFYAPLTLACIGLGAGLDGLAEQLERSRASLAVRLCALWRNPQRVLPLTVVAAAAAASALALGFPDRITPRVYEPLRARLDELDLRGRGARVLASDIGALGFFSRAEVLDSEGLVWPPAREFPDQPAALAAHLPEYFMIVVNRARMSAFLAHPVHERYRPLARFNASGATDLHPQPQALIDGWAQDYILYERVEQ